MIVIHRFHSRKMAAVLGTKSIDTRRWQDCTQQTRWCGRMAFPAFMLINVENWPAHMFDWKEPWAMMSLSVSNFRRACRGKRPPTSEIETGPLRTRNDRKIKIKPGNSRFFLHTRLVTLTISSKSSFYPELRNLIESCSKCLCSSLHILQKVVRRNKQPTAFQSKSKTSAVGRCIIMPNSRACVAQSRAITDVTFYQRGHVNLSEKIAGKRILRKKRRDHRDSWFRSAILKSGRRRTNQTAELETVHWFRSDPETNYPTLVK